MNRKHTLLLALFSLAAHADEKVDAGAAQGQMFTRINAAVEQRATELGLGKDVVTYCRIELNLHASHVPADGSVPFGVNYNEIKTTAELNTVIEVREAYEKTFLLLCLSRAKRDLSLAKEPPNKSLERTRER
jgi:hypothetical protein